MYSFEYWYIRNCGDMCCGIDIEGNSVLDVEEHKIRVFIVSIKSSQLNI